MIFSKKLNVFAALLFIVWSIASCTDEETAKPKKSYKDDLTSGTIQVAFDETYQPIMEQQLKVFDSSFPAAQLQVSYLPQEDCIDLLLKDSVRMIVAGRALSEAEKKYSQDNNLGIRSIALARDAVAVIVHKEAADKDFTKDMLHNILLNKFARKYDIVFDNARSGITKYVQDQLIPGQKFESNIYALHTADSVIDYVAKNKNSIGFVAADYIYDEEDETGKGKFIDKIAVAGVKSERDTNNNIYQPYQPNLFDGYYPLTRTLYVHIREKHRGLGTGFTNFLSQERGQRIFYLDNMLPLRVPLQVREVILK